MPFDVGREANMRMNSSWRLASVTTAALLLALWATVCGADERPLMRAVILPELIPSVMQQLVPMTLDLPADRGQSQARLVP